jgi:hypothetical protein
VDQRAGLTVAPNAGSVEDFVQRHEQEPTLVRQVRNKVRKCAGCGKPNAFTLPHCNGCGLDLSTTAISFTNNVFVGFVYGIEKGACAHDTTHDTTQRHNDTHQMTHNTTRHDTTRHTSQVHSR